MFLEVVHVKANMNPNFIVYYTNLEISELIKKNLNPFCYGTSSNSFPY